LSRNLKNLKNYIGIHGGQKIIEKDQGIERKKLKIVERTEF
jgi:hypothetical protein